MQDLILFPFNGNAREALSAIDAMNQVQPTWNVLGFVDDNADLGGKSFHGYPVLGGKAILRDYPQAKVLACPGRPENFRRRNAMIDALNLQPEQFATIIHPQASVGLGCQVGYNTVLMAGVVLTTDARVGNHCVVLPNSVIAHESSIGDYTLMGSNVSVSGGITIEPRCYIGSGAKLIQEITIATGTLVGLGAVVLKSTAINSVVAGVPAKALNRVEAL